MGIQINIHNTDDLTDRDLDVLRALVGGTAAPEAKTPTPPAKKAAPAPAKKAEPEPEPEPDAGGDEDLKAKAIALATELVSGGGAAKVKAALTSVGAKRVSEVTDDKLPEFLAELEG